MFSIRFEDQLPGMHAAVATVKLESQARRFAGRIMKEGAQAARRLE